MTVREQELPAPEDTAHHRGVSRGWVLVAVLALLLSVGAALLWRASTTDSDGDGLRDRIETGGWQALDGTVYRTSPDQADSDGDGLTDLDEAGAVTTDADGQERYEAPSDPTVVDTDDDGLGDGAEADTGLDARDADADDDGLLDGYEVDVVGTDPEAVDTDGDGFDDAYEEANRESQGLDPLRYDEEVSLLDYAADFTKGALAGDLMREDSLAWLAGNLVSGVIGASDLRDALGSALQGDWVGSGYSVLGAIPFGDVVTVPRKVARFVEKNPALAGRAATMIIRTEFIPDPVKLATARAIWPDWKRLVDGGADERSLIALVRGGTDLSSLAQAQRRTGHAVGKATKAQARRKAAVAAFVSTYSAVNKVVKQQARLSTEGCPDCEGTIRIVDALESGTAHTVKVGYVSLNEHVQRQIRKDAWLLRTGAVQSVQWHFVASSYSGTLGADGRVLDLLDQVGIAYTIHLPTES